METQFVYVVTTEDDLYRFDPPSLQFALVGHLSCPSVRASPYSMAVDRRGVAWVVFTSGEIFQVDTKNADCRSTNFVPGQHGFSTFGMGFSSNTPGSVEETLFVSPDGPSSLGVIDTTTLVLNPIGPYDLITDRRAELTGTGDARLFGSFEGNPYVVAEIGKTDAKIRSQATQSTVSAGRGSNFAFAFWGGDFWLFVGPGGSTDVFRYRPSSSETTMVKTVPFEIVGAGVSTCAPVAPPR